MIDNENTSTEASQEADEAKALKRRRDMIIGWVKGRSIHMNLGGNQTCCPDYSCCSVQLKAPKPFRVLYLKAFMEDDVDLKHDLLCTFSQYWCEINAWSNPTESKYYTDWMRDTNHFGLWQEIVIRYHMWTHNIKF